MEVAKLTIQLSLKRKECWLHYLNWWHPSKGITLTISLILRNKTRWTFSWVSTSRLRTNLLFGQSMMIESSWCRWTTCLVNSKTFKTNGGKDTSEALRPACQASSFITCNPYSAMKTNWMIVIQNRQTKTNLWLKVKKMPLYFSLVRTTKHYLSRLENLSESRLQRVKRLQQHKKKTVTSSNKLIKCENRSDQPIL